MLETTPWLDSWVKMNWSNEGKNKSFVCILRRRDSFAEFSPAAHTLSLGKGIFSLEKMSISLKERALALAGNEFRQPQKGIHPRKPWHLPQHTKAKTTGHGLAMTFHSESLVFTCLKKKTRDRRRYCSFPLRLAGLPGPTYL
jgi:hypothetical protein